MFEILRDSTPTQDERRFIKYDDRIFLKSKLLTGVNVECNVKYQFVLRSDTWEKNKKTIIYIRQAILLTVGAITVASNEKEKCMINTESDSD